VEEEGADTKSSPQPPTLSNADDGILPVKTFKYHVYINPMSLIKRQDLFTKGKDWFTKGADLHTLGEDLGTKS
jgi:hypothetical protein